LVVAALGWFAFYPLRANMAIQDGDQLLAKGEGNAALEAYDHATDLVPGSAVYWMRKGALLNQVQQPDLARQALVAAADRDPYDVNALVEAARLAEAQGDLTDARAKYERALEADPLGPLTIVAATTFELRHSGATEARRTLEDAVRLLPQEAPLWATLGDARAVLGASAAAREAYERALVLEPGQPVAVQGLEKLDG
jgi:tetratricopeptide (TPR) repeat protein